MGTRSTRSANSAGAAIGESSRISVGSDFARQRGRRSNPRRGCGSARLNPPARASIRVQRARLKSAPTSDAARKVFVLRPQWRAAFRPVEARSTRGGEDDIRAVEQVVVSSSRRPRCAPPVEQGPLIHAGRTRRTSGHNAVASDSRHRGVEPCRPYRSIALTPIAAFPISFGARSVRARCSSETPGEALRAVGADI
jgi:hypothetical protein